MVLPIALVAAGGIITRGVAFLLPRVLPTISKVFTLKTLARASVGLVGTGILLASPIARKKVAEAPKTALEFGKKVGKEIEQPTDKGITIKEGLVKAGIVGGVVAATVGGVKAIVKKRAEAKEKVLEPQDIIDVTPIEDITKPFGAVEKPKIVPKEKVQPSIKNTFNPTIDIRFSKSRKFINQQILVN